MRSILPAYSDLRPPMLSTRCAFLALLLAPALLAPQASLARVITIPAQFRVGPVQADDGNGLKVRCKDVSVDSCSIRFCKEATDTVTLQITIFPNVNFLLNTGSTFGPFNHGGSYFETRWDSFFNFKVAGDYIFSMQVDDAAQIAIGDSVILLLEGGHWFENQTSDTVRVLEPGLYPFRAYYHDCPFCCRGFRLGGMGPSGSGMMAFTPGFDFNNDLGPCCTFGGNGPGVSVVPGALFFQDLGSVDVPGGSIASSHSSIRSARAHPNPSRGVSELAVELGSAQALWAEVFDPAGRRVAMLASGEVYGRGVTRWAWHAPVDGAGRVGSGAYYYRVLAGDGSKARGTIVVVR